MTTFPNLTGKNTKPNVLVREFRGSTAFREVMGDFRRHLRARGLSDGTAKQRLIHMEYLHTHFEDVFAAKTEDLESLLSRRRYTHSAESRRSMRTSWQRFYAWALASGRTGSDPAAPLLPIRLPRQVARLAPDEKVAGGLRDASAVERAMVLLGRLAGLRLSEIATLHMNHRENDVLRITGKGGHTRMVPIGAELAAALEHLERMQPRGFYFPGRHDATTHMHPESVSKIIKRVTGCNAHSLRHAAATTAYERTKDLRGVQAFLGHATLVATERYVHVRAEQVRAVAEATSLGSGAL
ncbi:tyrosine-type recombinase/integrase [Pseudolysinimonas sp.]